MFVMDVLSLINEFDPRISHSQYPTNFGPIKGENLQNIFECQMSTWACSFSLTIIFDTIPFLTVFWTISNDPDAMTLDEEL